MKWTDKGMVSPHQFEKHQSNASWRWGKTVSSLRRQQSPRSWSDWYGRQHAELVAWLKITKKELTVKRKGKENYVRRLRQLECIIEG
jgi:hypothetical protein